MEDDEAPGEQRMSITSGGGEGDPSQLLQGVRDREAERRRDRERSPSRYEPVEKDW